MGSEIRRRFRRALRGPIGRAAATTALAASAALVGTSPARGQEAAFLGKCGAATPAAQVRLCDLTAQGVEISLPRIGLAASGGNPVQGTASTLGMRLGSFPRISVGVHVTGAHLELPPLRSHGDIGVFAAFLGVNASAAVFDGVRLLPTVGGFGSVDALGSLGVARLPGDFANGAPVAYGLGVRLGLLRESFTMPGVSVSGMYRHVGRVDFGNAQADSASFILYGTTDLSLRVAVSKRLFVLGTTVGVGWDRYRSDVAAAVRNTTVTAGIPSGTVENGVFVPGYTTRRFTAFANLSWTMLVLHAVGEVGWQRGTEPATLAAPTGSEDLVRNGSLYGSLALRLSI